MAWDFETDPEFQKKLDWIEDFMREEVDDNAKITKEILHGRKGPKRDVVCLNAAPALVAGRKAKTLQEGFRLAGRTIDSGAAAEKLARLVAYTGKGSRP